MYIRSSISAIALLICLISCSDKSTDASLLHDSDSITADSSDLKLHQINEGDFNEDLIPENTETIVTQEGFLYIDSLLQNSSGVTLEYGQAITIKQFSGTVLKGNWAEPVYHVIFKFPAVEDEYSGYLPISNLACFQKTLSDHNNVYLTLQFDSLKNNFRGNVLLTDAKNKKISDKKVDFDIPIESEAPYTYYYYFSIIERKGIGLDGVQTAFSVGSAYDACGYPTIDKLFLWNGVKLIEGPETSSVSDAGVYHLTNNLYFPSDSLGKKGYITQIIYSEETLNESETPGYKKDSTVILYKWNRMAGQAIGDTIVNVSSIFNPVQKK